MAHLIKHVPDEDDRDAAATDLVDLLYEYKANPSRPIGFETSIQDDIPTTDDYAGIISNGEPINRITRVTNNAVQDMLPKYKRDYLYDDWLTDPSVRYHKYMKYDRPYLDRNRFASKSNIREPSDEFDTLSMQEDFDDRRYAYTRTSSLIGESVEVDPLFYSVDNLINRSGIREL